MKFKLIGVTVLMLAAASVIEAQPYYPAGPYPGMARPANNGPQVLVSEGFAKLMKFLQSDHRTSKAEAGLFLEKEIAPYFDFSYMARWAAGPGYRNLSPKQRVALAQRIKEDFLTTLTERLAAYAAQTVRILPARYRGPDQATVGVLIENNTGAYPSRLEFRFYRVDGGWKVFDVSANGSSALVYYRRLLNDPWSRPGVPPRMAP
jgi:phospholipid transport system substrate-binding protein